MSAKLTVLIPCKNERKNIRPAIESIRDLADEILVADSGSTDGTLDIVRSMGGCRLIEREYVHSADFKNWAIPQASHEWVLVLDADERITPELARELRGHLDRDDPAVDGYRIGRDNHYLGHPIRHCGWNNDYVLRLMRRDLCRYQQRWVHAEVELPRHRTQVCRHRMLHYTTWDSHSYLEKLDRYATWGALNARDERRSKSLLGMMLIAPARFLQLYLIRGGFLDGVPGFHVCMHAAFYAYSKKAKRWEMEHAIPQPDPEADRVSPPAAAA
jgi:glycosyltransferase involved in cell wall biosynthesis